MTPRPQRVGIGEGEKSASESVHKFILLQLEISTHSTAHTSREERRKVTRRSGSRESSCREEIDILPRKGDERGEQSRGKSRAQALLTLKGLREREENRGFGEANSSWEFNNSSGQGGNTFFA